MDTEHSESPQRRTRLIIVIAVVVVLLLAAVLAVIVGAQAGRTPLPGEVASPSSSASPSATDATPASPSPTGEAAEPAEPREPLTPADPVPLDDEPEIVPGVSASIAKLESVQGEAFRPGEVAGPAVRVTVQIVNATDATVPLLATVVTAYYGDDLTPALELGAPGASPMPSEVAAGATASGVYVFTVPPEERGFVRIMVDYSVDVPPVVFEGAAPA